jgi:SAM-dependent methyltransferase
MSHWESEKIPQEVQAVFNDGHLPPGAALDLGCGTGTTTIYIARQGREAIGLDFVPKAIKAARHKAQQAGISEGIRFEVADVTRLEALDLPEIAFALDMGCFHGLKPEAQRRYAAGLAGKIISGGCFLLLTLEPHREAGIKFGVEPETVKEVFAPWFVNKDVDESEFWTRSSTWYSMERKAT